MTEAVVHVNCWNEGSDGMVCKLSGSPDVVADAVVIVLIVEDSVEITWLATGPIAGGGEIVLLVREPAVVDWPATGLEQVDPAQGGKNSKYHWHARLVVMLLYTG